jgi:hypothetical protein
VPAAQAEQVEQTVSVVGPHEAVWYWPAPQLEQNRHSVSAVALHAEAWYWPAVHTEHETQTPPLR